MQDNVYYIQCWRQIKLQKGDKCCQDTAVLGIVELLGIAVVRKNML